MPESADQAVATVDCAIDARFGAWLEASGSTVVITTYQAGKILFVGHDGEQVTILVRDAVAPMGLGVLGDRFALAVRDAVVVYEAEPAGPDFDCRYVPRIVHDARGLGPHDVAFGRDGLWVVATRASCLGLAMGPKLEPRWRPGFVSAVAPDDRCHLSGLAMDDGMPAYATAHGVSDAAAGWRDQKLGGGVIIDVATALPFAGGFTMPHSPRVANGVLYVCDSGHGVLARVDRKTGARTGVSRLPGFTRGLAIVGDHALVGLSKIRGESTFEGLPILARQAELLCGVALVDLTTGRGAGSIRFKSGATEIFDVAVLPGRRRVQLAG